VFLILLVFHLSAAVARQNARLTRLVQEFALLTAQGPAGPGPNTQGPAGPGPNTQGVAGPAGDPEGGPPL
jgi:hypothetical protein